ncbi:MAG TPA: ABC transporter permease [Solirubrobacteraceae bacterium]|nr:ABC transporter permease [Solirubrobacteraceae bacterium]
MTVKPPDAGPDDLPADAALAGVPAGIFDRRVRTGRRLKAEHVRDYGIVVFLVGIFIYFSLASPVFLTSGNLLNLVYANAVVGIPACAVTLTVIAGNFDLSLGAIFTLSEVLCAWAAVHWGVWWCFPIAIVSGAAMGLVNGAIITKLRVNAFLATLATALAFTGLALAASGGFNIIPPAGDGTFTFIGQTKVAGIQYPDLIFLVVAILLQLVLAYTVFGRHLYGVGGNRDAARLSGLKVDRIVITTFVLTGAACGVAGLVDASTTGQGSASNALGSNLALLAIAGVALGGTSIFGGVGSVWRTVVGVIMLGTITNGFNLLGVADYWQEVVRGLLIVVAVAVGSMIERR